MRGWEKLQWGHWGVGVPGNLSSVKGLPGGDFWDICLWDCWPWGQSSLGGIWLWGARQIWVWVLTSSPFSLKRAYFLIRKEGK